MPKTSLDETENSRFKKVMYLIMEQLDPADISLERYEEIMKNPQNEIACIRAVLNGDLNVDRFSGQVVLCGRVLR